MNSSGNSLKKERKSKGLSLKEIAEDTNISVKYLQALEEENYSLFPAAAYIKSFLRNYATFLGLNPTDLIQEYDQRSGETEVIKEEKKPVKLSYTRYYYVIIGLGVIILLTLIWFTYSHYILPMRLLIKEIPLSSPQMEIKKGLSLKVVVKEKTWIKVIADGKRVEERNLEAGEVKVWKAKNSLEIKVGNAGGIEFFLNDKSMGVLGKRGEVVTKIFNNELIQ